MDRLGVRVLVDVELRHRLAGGVFFVAEHDAGDLGVVRTRLAGRGARDAKLLLLVAEHFERLLAGHQVLGLLGRLLFLPHGALGRQQIAPDQNVSLFVRRPCRLEDVLRRLGCRGDIRILVRGPVQVRVGVKVDEPIVGRVSLVSVVSNLRRGRRRTEHRIRGGWPFTEQVVGIVASAAVVRQAWQLKGRAPAGLFVGQVVVADVLKVLRIVRLARLVKGRVVEGESVGAALLALSQQLRDLALVGCILRLPVLGTRRGAVRFRHGVSLASASAAARSKLRRHMCRPARDVLCRYAAPDKSWRRARGGLDARPKS